MTSRKNDEPPTEVSSPACFMHEATDLLHGLCRQGRVDRLSQRVFWKQNGPGRGSRSRRRAPPAWGRFENLMRTIQRDEARWCGMLLGHIKARGEAPSPNAGAFYAKAMAIWISTSASCFSIEVRAGWCASCARCYRACATICFTPTSARCCARMRPILRLPMRSRAAPDNNSSTFVIVTRQRQTFQDTVFFFGCPQEFNLALTVSASAPASRLLRDSPPFPWTARRRIRPVGLTPRPTRLIHRTTQRVPSNPKDRSRCDKCRDRAQQNALRHYARRRTRGHLEAPPAGQRTCRKNRALKNLLPCLSSHRCGARDPGRPKDLRGSSCKLRPLFSDKLRQSDRDTPSRC